MEPFNIKVNIATKEITLTILPIAANVYKLIYNGGIIGGIDLSAKRHKFVEPETLEPGGLPLYDYKKGVVAEEPLTLTNDVMDQIALEIEQQAFAE